MKNGLLKYAFFKDSQIKGGSFVKIIMKTAKMKLPLHEFSFVKAAASSSFGKESATYHRLSPNILRLPNDPEWTAELYKLR